MSSLPVVIAGNYEPLFNIGVVTRMTGISMATLRAWERRYDFPESERTAGGHRLYSERDVLRLRWVKERIEEGMQTAQAINALRHQETTGHLVQIPQISATQETAFGEPGAHLAIYQRQLYDALLRRDFQTADLVLGDALVSSNPDDIILDIIGPTLAQIGDAWESGRINIGQEHLTTNYLRQKLQWWMMNGAPPRPVSPILLACAPDEWHEGSLLILGALLRRRRWPVAYLGQSVPLEELARIVQDVHPAMIVLTAMTEATASGLVDWPMWLPKVAQNGSPIIGYGGRIFTKQPDWQTRVPGKYLGDNFREAIDNIERMI